MTDDNQDFGPFATEIFEDVYGELESRLTQSLAVYPEADRIAILSAISKAGWRGIMRGIALTTYAVNRKASEAEAEDEDADVIRLDTQIRTDAEPDLWAQRYGETAE